MIWSFLSHLQTCEEDVSQFDQRFTKETPIDSPCDKMLSESVDQIFQVSLIKFSDECLNPFVHTVGRISFLPLFYPLKSHISLKNSKTIFKMIFEWV